MYVCRGEGGFGVYFLWLRTPTGSPFIYHWTCPHNAEDYYLRRRGRPSSMFVVDLISCSDDATTTAEQ